MGPTCVLSAPGGPHVGLTNLAIWVRKMVRRPYRCYIGWITTKYTIRYHEYLIRRCYFLFIASHRIYCWLKMWGVGVGVGVGGGWGAKLSDRSGRRRHLWKICATTMEERGWVGLWGFLWWAPSAKGKDHHGVSSGWSSVWHRSNTGLSSTQYEQIPIMLGVWPFWLTPFFFRSITFWRAYG